MERKYTRVELLVTLVCACVLAALVHPLARAAATRPETCMNNEKILGTMLSAYAADSDGYLPYPIGNDYRAPFSWVVTLYRGGYIDGFNKDLKFYNEHKTENLRKLSPLLSCPAAGADLPDNEMRGWWCVKSGSSGDYGINCYFSTSDSSGKAGNFSGSIRIGDCAKPASSILLADTLSKQFHLLYGDSAVVLRHDDGVNLLMGDGSVRFVDDLAEDRIRHGF